ncbi:glycosyltransferase family 2 protein, partial [Lactiplantibacillus garii]|uniref:glycosyltransferase family 2 protein n=1 Tax=Lactiplantibacillus garii TaxID=2306423 RepID=UPI001CDC3755
METSVCAIVVTYNRSELLKKCLNAIKNQSVVVDHIMVIDNNSTDETQKIMIADHTDGLIYKRLDKNYGGAGGFKRGIQAALTDTNDAFLWIMDDDTIPTESALGELLKATTIYPNFGFLASNVHWKDGTPMNVPWTTRDWSVSADKGLIKVEVATFVSLFVPRGKVESVGLPFEDFFIWGDDVEYTLRLSATASCYFVAGSVVNHESGSNQAPSVYTDDANRISRYFYLYRNELYTARKHRGKVAVISTLIRDCYVSLKALVVSPNHKVKRSFIVFKGMLSGINFKPKY